MKLAILAFRLLLVFGVTVAMPVHAVQAQQTGTVARSVPIDTFAAAHFEIATLRAKAQAELAEPRAKKPEVQVSLRDKLQAETHRILKAHNLTEAEFSRLTRQVSTDDALRKQFEEALARLGAGKGG